MYLFEIAQFVQNVNRNAKYFISPIFWEENWILSVTNPLQFIRLILFIEGKFINNIDDAFRFWQ